MRENVVIFKVESSLKLCPLPSVGRMGKGSVGGFINSSGICSKNSGSSSETAEGQPREAQYQHILVDWNQETG